MVNTRTNSGPRKSNYKKGGNAGVEGTLYQINLLTIFLLKGLDSTEEWYLSTENDDAGKFDDLVFESPDGDIFLQAKHKKNVKKKISYEDLLSTNSKNDDFSLPKYFFSYVEIKDKFNIKTVIICTNNDLKLDAELKKHTKRQNLTPDNMLYYHGGNSNLYTFNESIVTPLTRNVEVYYEENLQRKNIPKDLITDENIITFLNCLQFLASYPNKGNLDTAVEKIISETPYSKNLDVKTAYNFIYKKMQDWFKQEKGVYLSKSHAKAFFCEIRSDEYCSRLEKFEVRFENNDLPVKDPNKKFWHVVPQEDYILNVLKIFRSLQKINVKEFLVVAPDFDENVKEMIVEAFRMPLYVYLVIACADGSTNFITEVLDTIKATLDASKYKKVILIADEGHDLAEYFKETNVYALVEEEIEFSDISEETQDKIKAKKNVLFQGQPTSLTELVEDGLNDFIDADTLVKLVTDSEIRVGSRVEPLSEDVKNYYIHRTFNPNNENISEEKLCELYDSAGKIVLVSDSPGMGKTTVLTYLANVLKENNPSLWVVKVDVNDYTGVLFEISEQGDSFITIPQLLDSHKETELRSELEKKLFSSPGKVLLMIDGVDEISPDYKEIVLNLILDCKAKPNYVRIYVTTRPHLRDELEKKLNVKALTLSPFSESNQVDFLSKYWKRRLGLKKSVQTKKCELYARELVREISRWISDRESNLLAAVPLQTRMIAEVFQEKKHLDDDGLGDWHGCNEYLTSNGRYPKLPKQINLTRLYQLFMSKKRQIFMQDKSKLTGNVITTDAVKKVYEECQLYHRLLALQTILRAHEVRLMETYKRLREKQPEDKNVVKLGIVQKLGGTYHFIHRTFGEFYVAECYLLELRCEKQNEQFQMFFIEEVLLLSDYDVVRAFLNNFLQRELQSIPPGTYRAYASLDYSDTLYDQSGTTFLHVLVKQDCMYLLAFILKCLNEPVDLDKVRDSFGKTLLHYSSQKHLDLVKLVMERPVDVNALDYDDQTPLHDAVNFNRLDIAKFLLERGANVDAKDIQGKTALHIAAEDSNSEMVELLLASGADVDIADEDGGTALHEGCNKWDVDVVKALLDNGACVDRKNDTGATPLHLACQMSPALLSPLLEHGAAINEENKEGATALHILAQSGDAESFKYLVERGGDINAGDREGSTPFHWAAHPGGLDVLNYLSGERHVNIDIGNTGGDTALHRAAKEGYIDVVTFLIGKGADVNVQSRDGYTPLHEASRRGHLVVVEHLVEAGADVNLTDRYARTALHDSYVPLDVTRFLVGKGLGVNGTDTFHGRTVLHYALLSRHGDCIEYLVEAGSDVNVGDRNGCTPLHYAIENGNLEIAKYLITRGAIIDKPDSNGCTLLHKAADRGNLGTLLFLLGTNIDVNVKNKTGRTALHEVFKSTEYVVELAKLLVEHGADVTAMDDQGRTPLHDSITKSPLETVDLLIRKGAKVEVSDAKGYTPLLTAIIDGNTDKVRLLVENGAGVNARSALTLAARFASLDVIKILVESGADINMVDEEGRTALHISARWNYSDKVRYLLDNNAFVDAENNRGCTALHEATRPGCLELLKCLLAKNANVNARNEDGHTPLHVAAQRACLYDKDFELVLQVMKFLIESGAEVNSRDSCGRTPLHLAAMGGWADKVELLVANGADVAMKDEENCTPRDCAAKRDREEVVKVLDGIRS